jgi:hypothetical protein
MLKADYTVWNDNDKGFLVRDASGLFNYWWAGCLMADDFCTLEQMFVPDSVERMRELSETAPTHGFISNPREVGGYGEPFSMDFSECVPLDQITPEEIPDECRTSMTCPNCGSEKDIVGGDGRILLLDCGCRILSRSNAVFSGD